MLRPWDSISRVPRGESNKSMVQYLLPGHQTFMNTRSQRTPRRERPKHLHLVFRKNEFKKSVKRRKDNQRIPHFPRHIRLSALSTLLIIICCRAFYYCSMWIVQSSEPQISGLFLTCTRRDDPRLWGTQQLRAALGMDTGTDPDLIDHTTASGACRSWRTADAAFRMPEQRRDQLSTLLLLLYSYLRSHRESRR